MLKIDDVCKIFAFLSTFAFAFSHFITILSFCSFAVCIWWITWFFLLFLFECVMYQSVVAFIIIIEHSTAKYASATHTHTHTKGKTLVAYTNNLAWTVLHYMLEMHFMRKRHKRRERCVSVWYFIWMPFYEHQLPFKLVMRTLSTLHLRSKSFGFTYHCPNIAFIRRADNLQTNANKWW